MTKGRRWAASTGEDELLSRLYQQITERQAAQFASGYDMAAGLDRYRAWLAEHAADQPREPKATQQQGAAALRAAFADTNASTAAAAIGATVVLRRTTQGSAGSGTLAAGAWDADRAVTTIYTTHYRPLVRLAILLVRDVATAEEIVQDSFIAMHRAWRRLGDTDKALSYLRQCVVNRSRSMLRHQMMVDKNAPKLAPDLPSAQQDALTPLEERSAVISALRTLPPRQREVMVLRYYADLSDAQIASAMGISIGAVKSHAARGISSLRAALALE